MYGLGYGLGITQRRGVPYVGPLDGFAGQLYATSGLCRLLSAYGGPLVRMRRASDGAETDIGFVEDGGLDVAALLAFAGASSAYSTLWHDQTGNGHHGAQATGAAQPRLVNAGVLDVGPNGRPALVFSGAQYLELQSSVGFVRDVAAATYAAVSRATAASGQSVLATSTTGSAAQARSILAYSPNSTAPVFQARNTDVSTLTALTGVAVSSGAWTRLIGRARYAAGGADIAVNGTVNTGAMTPAQNTPIADTVVGVRIGQFSSGSLSLTGGMSTVVLAQSALDIAALNAALAQVMP
ncbi:arabinofuranosidase catalytic domain-containing protein [Ancylobacter sp.]|uniref:arabinofuranosidase catalytic domain-containing protein n=1 Tax=Ancylobacter sp. TaxID=1872567 RepID=UPI003D0A4122